MFLWTRKVAHPCAPRYIESGPRSCLMVWIIRCLPGTSRSSHPLSSGCAKNSVLLAFVWLYDVKSSAFLMISWSKNRFFVWFLIGAKIMFMAFITCKCARETLVLSTRGDTWGHVVGHVSQDMDIDVLLMYGIPLVKKILQKSSEKVWRLCFITLLLHPHSRENVGTKWWNKLLGKKFRNNLEV